MFPFKVLRHSLGPLGAGFKLQGGIHGKNKVNARSSSSGSYRSAKYVK